MNNVVVGEKDETTPYWENVNRRTQNSNMLNWRQKKQLKKDWNMSDIYLDFSVNVLV
jgi:hypothetical protein